MQVHVSSAAADYASLINRFLCEELRAEAFQLAYLEKFKNEARDLEPREFELLDQLFVDVDAFEADTHLLAGLRAENPGAEYLDEQALRGRASDVLRELSP